MAELINCWPSLMLSSRTTFKALTTDDATSALNLKKAQEYSQLTNSYQEIFNW